jgi:hypothetical protein
MEGPNMLFSRKTEQPAAVLRAKPQPARTPKGSHAPTEAELRRMARCFFLLIMVRAARFERFLNRLD